MSKYYVFRINYGDNFKRIREELLVNNRLRQGWGTYDMAIDKGYDSFKDGWRKNWDENIDDDTARPRYGNLVTMLDIEPGDYIIIPKVSVNEDYPCRSFTIAKCKSKYSFDVLQPEEDYGHIIEVEDVFSCGYDANEHSQAIKNKFRAYQSPLNNVWNDPFKDAVDELVKMHAEDPTTLEQESMDFISMVDHASSDARTDYLNKIKSSIQNLGNSEFEKLIGELFEKNGYAISATHRYDGQGGDIDLVFDCFCKNTLMNNIFDICEVEPPHIYVQAKKKTGIDAGDIIGVNQLINMSEQIREKDKNPILMVINMTDKFSQDAIDKAKEEGIVLIDGLMFASLLVRYGIEVELYNSVQNEKVPSSKPTSVINDISVTEKPENTAQTEDYTAMYNLALDYLNGKNVPRDRNKARELMFEAAEGGSPEAQFKLYEWYNWGDLVPKDRDEGLRWLVEAAKNGVPHAEHEMGVCWVMGDFNRIQDYNQAFAWFSKAAAHGYAHSYYRLYELYRDGNGVEKDLDKALECLNKADELGDDISDWDKEFIMDMIAQNKNS